MASSSAESTISSRLNGNQLVDFNIALYPPSCQLLVRAMESSALAEAMTLQKSVPLEFVIRALETFEEVDDNHFAFEFNGKRKRINRTKFSKVCRLKVNGDSYTPTNQELFMMVNEMGHLDLVSTSSKFLNSRLPEPWALMYKMVVYGLCGKTTGPGKINMQQLIVMFGLYRDVNVDADEYIFNEFVAQSKKATDIVFHRFWGALIAHEMKKVTNKPEWEELPKMSILPWTLPGARMKEVVFDYVGQIPNAMLMRIIPNDPLLLEHNRTFTGETHRDYDVDAFFKNIANANKITQINTKKSPIFVPVEEPKKKKSTKVRTQRVQRRVMKKGKENRRKMNWRHSA